MDGIDGLAPGDSVTTEQMRALFGCGLHPLAELRQQHLEVTQGDFQNAVLLGVPFKIVDNDLLPFRLEVAKRIAALNAAIGLPADASIAAADRAFLAEHGREPMEPPVRSGSPGLRANGSTHALGLLRAKVDGTVGDANPLDAIEDALFRR